MLYCFGQNQRNPCILLDYIFNVLSRYNFIILSFIVPAAYGFIRWIGRAVRQIVEGPPMNLLESVAQQIASTTLSKYPQISAVRVTVGKPHVAVQGPVDYLGVEILRYQRSDGQQ